MARKKKEQSIAEEVLKTAPAPPDQEGYEDEVEQPDPPTPQEFKARMKEKRQRAAFQRVASEGDLVDIWERRIKNPYQNETLPIRIKTPGMRLRWINLSNRGRFQRARYVQGWVPVRKEELMDEREIFGVSYTSEGYVCRGEKQGEMLMKIPTSVYNKIRREMVEQSKRADKQFKDNLASAGAVHMKDKHGASAGDQAADIVHSFKGDVKFGTERVSSDELFE